MKLRSLFYAVLFALAPVSAAMPQAVNRSALTTQNNTNITTNNAAQITGAKLNAMIASIIASAGTLLDPQTWVAAQTFSVAPTFTSLTGYCYANAASPVSCATTVPLASVPGAAPTASPTFTGIAAAPTAALGTNTTQLATTAFVLANAVVGASPPISNVRQTVLSGPQTAGVPTFLPNTSGSLSITSQNIAAGTPLVVSAANGFSSTGDVNLIGVSTANLTWSGLTASTTNYLGVTVASGANNSFSTTLLPIYQYGGTIAVTTGQYTFDVSQMQMFLGNGTVATQTSSVFVGEVITNGTTVTSAIDYQYLGYYDSGFINTLPGTGVITSKNTYLGITDTRSSLSLKNLTAESGFVVGDIINDGVASYFAPIQFTSSRNSIKFATSTGSAQAFYINNISTGASATITSANWAYRIISRRSWGGA